MNFKDMWSYKPTITYLLKKKGLRATYNFAFVKMFVIHGEGGVGWALKAIEPFLRKLNLLNKLTPYPYNLEIEITNKCDKKCILCEHTYWDEPSRDLTYKQFLHIVSQFPKLKWVNLTGEGDAFLNPDYIKMIEHLKQKDIPVFLVDSFNRIDEPTAEKLVELGVDGIWISWDGATPETYESIKKGCNFHNGVKNIKYLLKQKKLHNSPIPEICFRYIITTKNMHEMSQFPSFVKSIGTKKELGDRSVAEFVGLLSFPEIEHLFVPHVPQQIITETKQEAQKHNIDVSFAHPGTTLPPMEKCTAWMEPYIMMGGYVMPCCAVLMSNNRDFLRENALGNIYETPFKDIWNSPRYKQLRHNVIHSNTPVPKLCAGCRAFDTTKREKTHGVLP